MSTIVDIDTGLVLGFVDGRNGAPIGFWLKERSEAWRDAVQVVAIDPSAAFRKALREQPPHAAVSGDAFHLVKLGNDRLTDVRQRLAREQQQRRGRLADPPWMSRRLLLRGADTLTARGRARLRAVGHLRRYGLKAAAIGRSMTDPAPRHRRLGHVKDRR